MNEQPWAPTRHTIVCLTFILENDDPPAPEPVRRAATELLEQIRRAVGGHPTNTAAWSEPRRFQ